MCSSTTYMKLYVYDSSEYEWKMQQVMHLDVN